MKTRISDLFDSYEGETAPVGAPPADPRRILALTTEKIELEKPKKRRRLRVLAIAAAALLLGGAAAAASSDGGVRWLEEHWRSLTGSEMSDAQQTFVNGVTDPVGLSQTHDGVTVTVDSVIHSPRQVWVLLNVTFAQPRPDVNYVGFQPMPDDSAGTVLSGSGSASRVSDTEWQIACEFDLADGASAGQDKDFSLQLGRLQVCTEGSDEPSESDDAWTFSFTLPAVADVQRTVMDEPIRFEDAEITNISVTESGCSFEVTPLDGCAPDGSYGRTDMDAAKTALLRIDGVSEYAVEAVLTDGTAVAVGSVSWSGAAKTGRCECVVDWAAPIDVSQLDQLVFTDLFAPGAPKIAVSVN